MFCRCRCRCRCRCSHLRHAACRHNRCHPARRTAFDGVESSTVVVYGMSLLVASLRICNWLNNWKNISSRFITAAIDESDETQRVFRSLIFIYGPLLHMLAKGSLHQAPLAKRSSVLGPKTARYRVNPHVELASKGRSVLSRYFRFWRGVLPRTKSCCLKRTGPRSGRLELVSVMVAGCVCVCPNYLENKGKIIPWNPRNDRIVNVRRPALAQSSPS